MRFGEAVDVRWNPYDASYDNHDSWQNHLMSCEFDSNSIDLLRALRSDSIEVHLHRKHNVIDIIFPSTLFISSCIS